MKEVLAEEKKRDGRRWVILDGPAERGERLRVLVDGRIEEVCVKYGGEWPIGKVMRNGRSG